MGRAHGLSSRPEEAGIDDTFGVVLPWLRWWQCQRATRGPVAPWSDSVPMLINGLSIQRASTKGRNFVPGFGTHETKSSTEGK